MDSRFTTQHDQPQRVDEDNFNWWYEDMPPHKYDGPFHESDYELTPHLPVYSPEPGISRR